MNTPNNQRKKLSKEKIKEALKYYGTLSNLDYHIAFFKAGINAILKKWLFNGCIESPEELAEVLNSEYKGKSLES